MRFPISRGLFRAPTDFVHAVDGISFEIAPGESLGLVGESGLRQVDDRRGCSSSSSSRPAAASCSATASTSATWPRVKGREVKEFRRRVQMIFQDPYESMNPRRTIYDTVCEPLAVQKVGSMPERERRVLALLRLVGLTPPENFLFRYPHELSGGQRQRVAIARALVMSPSFVVADEPTSMLDVSIRISIMELMAGLAREFEVSYLYITHDLAVARYMCDRIAVMYLGKIVEIGPTEEILARPEAPVHEGAALGGAGARTRRSGARRSLIKGGISKAINPPPECRFIERCPFAAEVCRTNPHPPLERAGRPTHFVACYRVDEIEELTAAAAAAGLGLAASGSSLRRSGRGPDRSGCRPARCRPRGACASRGCAGASRRRPAPWPR